MAHFAHITSDGIVDQVIVAEQSFINMGCVGNPDEWVQTSYNTRGGEHHDLATGAKSKARQLRKNYAGIGYVYNKAKDAFYAKQPYPSWVLDEEICIWQPPVPCPVDGKMYSWDESIFNWVEVVGLP